MKKIIILLILMFSCELNIMAEHQGEHTYLVLRNLSHVNFNNNIFKITGTNDDTNKSETWYFIVNYLQRVSGFSLDYYKSITFNGESMQLFLWINSKREAKEKRKSRGWGKNAMVEVSPPDSFIIEKFYKIK